MTKHEVDAQATENPQSETPEVKVPFNPFTLLSEEQVTALAGRFTKSWRKQFSTQITDISTLYACSTAEASFAAYLMNDADAIITRNKIKDCADSIVNLLSEVTGKSSEVALQTIETLYSSIDAVNRPDVGKRVRSIAADTYSLKMADILLNKVYEHLGIKENEWK